jgi:hypothetical protein
MLTKAVKFLLLTEAFAVATFAGGWWGVPVLAFVWGLAAASNARSARFSAVCAAAGWGSLLLLDAARGPVGEVATRFGGVIGLPPVALIGITLLFPALLAWSASSIGAAMRKAILVRRVQPAEAATEPVTSADAGGGVAIADV